MQLTISNGKIVSARTGGAALPGFFGSAFMDTCPALNAPVMQACRQPLPLNEQQCSIDPASPELFFYSLQYDHTVKRFDTEWLERDAGIAQPIRRCQVVLKDLHMVHMSMCLSGPLFVS